MVDDRELRAMRPYVGAMVAAVANEDETQMRIIYERLGKEFGVVPAEALVVLMADELRIVQGRWRRESARATEFAEAYLEGQRKVKELRAILMKETAASTASRVSREKVA